MAKKITGYIKLQVPAGAANPSPPIGPALGQRGLNIMEFCKAFNAQTQKLEKGAPIPVVITVYAGPVLHLRDEDAAGFLSSSRRRPSSKADRRRPAATRSARSPQAQVREIAEQKMKDLNCDTARSRRQDDRRLRPLDGHRSGGRLTMAQGKRYTKAREGVDRDKLYPLEEAVKMVKERAKAKFDETIEVAMNLGVDPRHADQMVRGVVNLPNGSGRNVRVGVFARGAKAEEAKAAGADVVGAEDLVEKVNGGDIDFDRCIATPDMMPLVGRLGKVLGPRGMMPNPKVGTVTMDVTNAVKGAKGGSVEFRVEKAGIVQAGVGKASFSAEQLVAEHQGVRRCGGEGQARRRQGHVHREDRGVLDHGPGPEDRAEFDFRHALTLSNFGLRCASLAGGANVSGRAAAPPQFLAGDPCAFGERAQLRPHDARMHTAARTGFARSRNRCRPSHSRARRSWPAARGAAPPAPDARRCWWHG